MAGSHAKVVGAQTDRRGGFDRSRTILSFRAARGLFQEKRPPHSRRDMSYRIHVHPEAGSRLRTLAPHVVLRLGHSLAELAEAAAPGSAPDAAELRVDDCVMQLVVDHGERLLRVTNVDEGSVARA
jgi:hypothetical protein